MGKSKYFALYEGDDLLTVGTYKELASYLGVGIDTVRFYTKPTYKKRVKNSRYEIVELEDEIDEGVKMEVVDKELIRFIEKDKQKRWLDLFMILTELNKKEDIISFTYDKNYITIKTGVNDYYRIHLKSKEVN